MTVVANYYSAMAKAVFIGLLVSIALFSTTYTVGGFFIYPRLMLALAGVVTVLTTTGLKRLLTPSVVISWVLVAALAVAAVHGEWRHLFLFWALVIRGIILPYFTAILLIKLISKPVLRFIPKQSWNFIAIILFSALAFQAVIVVIQLLIPDFRSSYLIFVNLDDSWREMATLGLPRFSGLGGISIYDTSLTYCIIGAVLLVNHGYKFDRVWLYASIVALVMLLCILHGRTGLLFTLVLLVLIAVQEMLKLWRNPSVILRFLLLLVLLAYISYTAIDPQSIGYIVESSGELIINYINGDGFRSDSTDELLKDYLGWPSGQALLMGSGIWAQPDLANNVGYPYSTDSGYLLLINFGGVFFLLIFGIVFSYFVYSFCKSISNVKARRFVFDKSLFSLYLGAVLLITSIKGPLFLSEHFMTTLFLLLGIYYRFVLPLRVVTRLAPHSVGISNSI
jgi:hypothetical protein